MAPGIFFVHRRLCDREIDDGGLEEGWGAQISTDCDFSDIHGSVVVGGADRDCGARKMESGGPRAAGCGSRRRTAATGAGIWPEHKRPCSKRQAWISSKELDGRPTNTGSNDMATTAGSAAVSTNQSSRDAGIPADHRVAISLPGLTRPSARRYLPACAVGRNGYRMADYRSDPARDYRAIPDLIGTRYKRGRDFGG